MKSTTSAPVRRLVDDRGAAAYLSVSRSYIRRLLARGVLHRVNLPATESDDADARMLRIDVRDLDRWIDSMKGTSNEVERR